MKYNITIIGAGIVGFVTAYAILKKNPNIRLLIIEKEIETDAIDKLITNQELRLKLGTYAKERALREFTDKKMVEETYKVYQDLLKK